MHPSKLAFPEKLLPIPIPLHIPKISHKSPSCMAWVNFKLLPLLVSEQVRLFMGLLRVESWSPTALWPSLSQASLIFKAKHHGGSSSQCRSLPSVGLHPSLLSQDLYALISLPPVGCHARIWFLSCLCSSYPSFLSVFNFGRTALLVFRPFSERVALCVVAALVVGRRCAQDLPTLPSTAHL